MKAEATTETVRKITSVTLQMSEEEAVALLAIHGAAYTRGRCRDKVGARTSTDLYNSLRNALGDCMENPTYRQVKKDIAQPLDFREHKR